MNIRIVIAFILASSMLAGKAEDLIVFRNGEVVKAVVLEIQKTEVKYKRASNPQGPTYTVDKAELLSINYENGERDVFGTTLSMGNTANEVQQSSVKGPRLLEAVPAADNTQFISRINNSTVRHGNRKPNDKKLKTTTDHTWIMGVTEGSILSDENISISFIHTWESQYVENGKTKSLDYFTPLCYEGYYKILITNKTTHPIYIDAANSFRISPKGEAESFYNGVSITNTSGKQGGGSLGLGAVTNALGIDGLVGQVAQGIGIGGGATNSTSVTTTENRIIAIPPGGKVAMPKKIIIIEKTIYLRYESLNPDGVQPEVYQLVSTNNKNRFEKNKYVALPNGEENKGMSYYITYSTSSDFSTYYSIPFGFYVRGLFGSENDFNEFTADDGQVIIGSRW